MVARALAVLLVALALAPAAGAQERLPGGRGLVATTSLEPDTHLFAERVVARVDLVVDPRQFDPDRISVNVRFHPYSRVGSIEETRREKGGLVHIAYRATVWCLHRGCLAERFQTILGAQEGGRAERARFDFAPAEINYEPAPGRVRTLLRREFPTVEVVSRINTAQAERADNAPSGTSLLRAAYRASIEPPPPTYHVAPPVLAALAFVGAALLFAFPAFVGGRWLYGVWREKRRPRPLTPLERAVALVEWAGRHEDGEQERRKALEVLAEVLDERGAEPLADRTRRLAWASEAPPRQRAGELAAEARALEDGGNGRVH